MWACGHDHERTVGIEDADLIDLRAKR